MCNVLSTKQGDFCERTGLPITTVNELGSFCAKDCFLDVAIFSKTRAADWVNDMGPIFDQLKDDKK